MGGNTSVDVLYLENNQIGSDGIKYLIDSLVENKRHLKWLGMGWNSIGDDGAEFVSKYLLMENNTLTNLWFFITKLGTKELCV